jgi:hypothetical protein
VGKILQDFKRFIQQKSIYISRAITSPRRRYNIQRGKKLPFCSWHSLGFLKNIKEKLSKK